MPMPTSDLPESATVTGLVARTDLVIGSVVAERFRVDALVGIGGMGLVYRAWDVKLDVPVAIKVLRPEFARRRDAFSRFRDEILLSRQVSSPHVLRIHDLVADGERWLLAMDWIDGGSLESLLERERQLPVDRAVAITRQVALGLAAAHARGIIHRDLKPANILLDRSGNAYVSDFGVARAIGDTGLTGTGAIVGTPDYLSPEQASGLPLDGRSDLYAVGLILYEMLCGRLPFDRGTAPETIVRRLVQSPPPVTRWRPDAPQWVTRLVARLLAIRPHHRLPDAEAVVRAIDAADVGRGPLALRRAAAYAGALLLVAIVVTLGVRFDDWVRPRLEGWGASRNLYEWALLPLDAPPPEEPVARAVDELLWRQLVDQGVSVAGGIRTRRVLELLALEPGSASAHLDRIVSMMPARHWVTGSLRVNDERWSLRLHRSAGGDGVIRSEDRDGLTADALAPALAGAMRALGLDAVHGAGWPVTATALAEFGTALRAPREQAVAALERCLAIEPRFAAAWTERLRLAVADRDEADRTAVALRARAALAGEPTPAQERALAWAALAAGETSEARRRFEALYDARPHDLDSAQTLAGLLADAGETSRAAAILDGVLARDPYDVAVLVAAGRAALDAGEPQRAIDRYFGRALQIATRLADQARAGEALNGLGVAYERLGQPGPAVDHYTRAAATREAIGDARGAATSLRNLAHVLGVAGDFDAAAARLARARDLLVPLGDVAALAALATDEGLLAEERGDFAAAARAYLEALAARRSGSDVGALAEAHLNLAFVHAQTGEHASARTNAEAAWEAARTTADPVATTQAEELLAMLDLADGLLEPARARIESIRHAATALQATEAQAVVEVLAADAAALAGRYAEAEASLALAERRFAARSDRRGLTEVSLVRASILLAQDRRAEAAAVLDAIALRTADGGQHAARLRLLRAVHALDSGAVQAALDHAAAAADIAIRAGLRPLAANARLLSASAHAARGRLDLAQTDIATARAQLGNPVPHRLALEVEAAELALLPEAQLAAAHAQWRLRAGPLADGTLGRSAARSVAARTRAILSAGPRSKDEAPIDLVRDGAPRPAPSEPPGTPP